MRKIAANRQKSFANTAIPQVDAGCHAAANHKKSAGWRISAEMRNLPAHFSQCAGVRQAPIRLQHCRGRCYTSQRFYERACERISVTGTASGIRAAIAQASGGRRSRNGVAFSNASATRSTVASWNGLPTSCIATGSPPLPKPEQTDIAG